MKCSTNLPSHKNGYTFFFGQPRILIFFLSSPHSPISQKSIFFPKSLLEAPFMFLFHRLQARGFIMGMVTLSTEQIRQRIMASEIFLPLISDGFIFVWLMCFLKKKKSLFPFTTDLFSIILKYLFLNSTFIELKLSDGFQII